MTTTHELMTPRQLLQEISRIDARLAVLEPWVSTLTAARRRYLLAGETNSVLGIEHGFSREDGFPNDPMLAPLDPNRSELTQGKPALRRAEQEIEHLRERRDMLRELLPSEEETAQARAKAQKTAERTAAEITKRAARLEARTDALRVAAVKELARLALDVAEETYCVWLANAKLDAACAEAEIERPATPRPSAPQLPHAALLGRLLLLHFTGGQPTPVDGFDALRE